MATFGDLQDAIRYIKSLDKGVEQATLKALLATSVAARGFAIKNAKSAFTGRNGRTLTGNLMNNIYSGLEDGDGRFPDIYAGVKSIPYGAIHEFGSKDLPGGAITPKKAKNLWIPNHANAGKMTPREFIELMRKDPRMYHLTPKAALRAVGPQVPGTPRSKQAWVPLFYLLKKVEMPERPYIRPALQTALAAFPNYMFKYINQGV